MTGEEELLTLGSSEHVDAWYELIKSPAYTMSYMQAMELT